MDGWYTESMQVPRIAKRLTLAERAVPRQHGRSPLDLDEQMDLAIEVLSRAGLERSVQFITDVWSAVNEDVQVPSSDQV